jgi:hypothetical protein
MAPAATATATTPDSAARFLRLLLCMLSFT